MIYRLEGCKLIGLAKPVTIEADFDSEEELEQNIQVWQPVSVVKLIG